MRWYGFFSGGTLKGGACGSAGPILIFCPQCGQYIDAGVRAALR